MRLLANENFPGAAVAALRNEGHDVLWIRTECPGATDQNVLQIAPFRSRLPSQLGIVLFRLTPSSPDYISRVALAALNSASEWRGHFAVVEENRIRITPLPGQTTSQ